MDQYEELAMGWLNMTRGKAAPKTTQRRLTSLKQFAIWAGLSNPLSEYMAPKASKTIPHPIAEGYSGVVQMLGYAKNEQQKAIVAGGAFMGLRISESLKMSIPNFDINSMLLTVRGKGDKTRVVPISRRAWEWLSMPYLLAFNNPDQLLITYSDRTARKIVTDLGDAASLSRPVVSHDLRATFATEVFDFCKDIRVVQELLGHANINTTEIYTGATMDKLRKAVNFG